MLTCSALSGTGRRYVDDDEEEQYEPRVRSGGGGGLSGLSGTDKGAIGASSAYDDHDDAVQATRHAQLQRQTLLFEPASGGAENM